MTTDDESPVRQPEYSPALYVRPAEPGNTAKDIADKITKAMEGVTPGDWWTRQEVYGTHIEPSIAWLGNTSAHPSSETKANGEYIIETQPKHIRTLLSALADAERERDELRVGIKRLSDEEEMCSETDGGDAFDLVRLAAKLAGVERALDVEKAATDSMRMEREEAENRNELFRTRALDMQMLAFKWMDAHDKLKSGLPYDFPNPVDLPEAIARATAAESTAASQASLLDEARRVTDKPFCVLFLDGRNEHGSHVLPSFPRGFEPVDDDMNEQAEAILVEAERLGFAIGEHVWAEFVSIADQIGDEGRIELSGYWEFESINVEMSRYLNARIASKLGASNE